MSEEVIVRSAAEARPAPATSDGAAFLQVIERASRDSSVDVAKMQALLDMRERVVAWEAEREFKAALSRLQPRLPRITKQGTIVVPAKDGRTGHRTPYAKYEDINKAVRPLLAEEGFSVSYSFEGNICHCTLSHRDGHSKIGSTPPLPMDNTGSKNAVQAVGSMMAYAKRYALCNALDIVTVEQDDDAAATGYLTEDQLNKVRDLILACDLSRDAERKFLELMDAPSVEQIQQSRFDAAMVALNKKYQQVQRSRR